jgi:hypothetical protein
MRTEVAALRGHGLTWSEIARRTGLCATTARSLHAECDTARPLFRRVTWVPHAGPAIVVRV